MVEINSMTSAELEQVLENYPWFTAARAEYILRQGGEDMDEEAIYSAARRSGLFFLCRRDFNKILDKVINGEPETVEVIKITDEAEKDKKPSYFIAGGDYFGKSDFQELEEAGLAVESPVFTGLKDNADNAASIKAQTEKSDSFELPEGFYTETLAEVFAQQQFYQRAIDIYEKLILLYPEKSAYFASLIENLENLKQK